MAALKTTHPPENAPLEPLKQTRRIHPEVAEVKNNWLSLWPKVAHNSNALRAAGHPRANKKGERMAKKAIGGNIAAAAKAFWSV